MTMSNELTKITKRFGTAYDRSKKAETALKTQQQKLFQAFNKDLENRLLARRSHHYPAWKELNEKDQNAWVKKHHPGWKVVGYERGWLILEQDPAFQKFTFVNPVDGRVYGRTTVEGSPSLDDEALRNDNPELWKEITEWPEPWYSLVEDLIVGYTTIPYAPGALDTAVSRVLSDHGVQRVLKDINTLTDEQIMDMDDYFIPGPLTVRLVAPRTAKPEELEHTDEQSTTTT